MISANGLADEKDLVEDEEVPRLCVLPGPSRVGLVAVDLQLTISSQPAVVLELGALRHGPVGDAAKNNETF